MYQDDFVHSPIHDEIGCEKYKSHVKCASWINEVGIGGGGMDLTYENPEIWLSAGTPDPDAEVRIQTVVTVGNYEFHKIMKDDEGFEYDAMAATMGLPVRRVQDGWEYINNNHSECGNFSFQCPEEDVDVTEFPGHPAYTFTTATKGQTYGDSAPINAVMIQRMLTEKKQSSMLSRHTSVALEKLAAQTWLVSRLIFHTTARQNSRTVRTFRVATGSIIGQPTDTLPAKST